MFGRDENKVDWEACESLRKGLDVQMKMMRDYVSALLRDNAEFRSTLDDMRARLRNLEDAVYEMQNDKIAEVLHRDMEEVMAQHRPVTEFDEAEPAPSEGRAGPASVPPVLPCPECGRMPQVRRTYDELGIIGYGLFCAGSDHHYTVTECRSRTLDHAVRAWNRCVRTGQFKGLQKCVCTGILDGEPVVRTAPIPARDAEKEEESEER